MTGISEKDYIEIVYSSAKSLWGNEEAEKMRDHIEKNAGAVWRTGKIELSPGIEPVTKLGMDEF